MRYDSTHQAAIRQLLTDGINPSYDQDAGYAVDLYGDGEHWLVTMPNPTIKFDCTLVARTLNPKYGPKQSKSHLASAHNVASAIRHAKMCSTISSRINPGLIFAVRDTEETPFEFTVVALDCVQIGRAVAEDGWHPTVSGEMDYIISRPDRKPMFWSPDGETVRFSPKGKRTTGAVLVNHPAIL